VRPTNSIGPKERRKGEMICVCTFYYLLQADLTRGIPKDVVEKYTKTVKWTAIMREQDKFLQHTKDDDTDCAVCYCGYSFILLENISQH